MRFCVVGNPTIDTIYRRGSPARQGIGGGVYYSAKALVSSGACVSVFCSGTRVQERVMELIGVRELLFRYTAHPTEFELFYTGKERIIRLVSPGREIDESLIECSECDVALVNPVYHEVGLALIKKLKSSAMAVALDVQGLVRRADRKGFIHLVGGSSALEYINYAYIIHADYKEASALLGAQTIRETVDTLRRRYRDKLWVITGGSNTIIVIENGRITTADPPRIHGAIDETGAGDTFTAALVLQYMKNHDIEESIRFAIKVTTKKLLGLI